MAACLLGLAFGPGSSAQQAPARRQDGVTRSYTNRAHMHQAPVGLAVPGAEESPSLFDGLSILEGAPSVSFKPPPPPAGPRVRSTTPERSTKSRNWLVMPEGGEEQDVPAKPSGWGWLADDVGARQQKAEQAKEAEAKEEEKSLPAPIVREPTDEGGLFGNLSLRREGETQPKPEERRRGTTGEALPGQRDSRSTATEGFRDSTERTPAGLESTPAPGWASASDRMWGNERLWSREQKDERDENHLPQTTSLLLPATRSGQQDEQRRFGGLPRLSSQLSLPAAKAAQAPEAPQTPASAGLRLPESRGGSPAPVPRGGMPGGAPAGFGSAPGSFGGLQSIQPPKPVAVTPPVLPTQKRDYLQPSGGISPDPFPR